jgi:hypothetical protein
MGTNLAAELKEHGTYLWPEDSEVARTSARNSAGSKELSSTV